VKVSVIHRVGKLFFDYRYEGAMIKVSNDMTAPALRTFHLPVEWNVYRNWTASPTCIFILPFLFPVVEIGKPKSFVNGRPARVFDVLWVEAGGNNNVN
jgi:hypothetical protein